VSAEVIGPGGCVKICDADGDELQINADGSISIVVAAAPAGSMTWEYGSDTLVPAQTSAIISFLTAAPTRLAGFTAAGEGDARFSLELDGIPKLVGYIHAAAKSLLLTSPVELLVDPGVQVELVVRCDAVDVSLYEGTVFRT